MGRLPEPQELSGGVDPDSEEGCRLILEHCDRVLADASLDWLDRKRWETRKRCTEDRLAAMRLPPRK
jgi:hypothetical protein